MFDEPEVAAAKHRAILRRLFALQIRDALKYLEKNLPDLQKMAVAYMPLGTQEELRSQILDVAMDRVLLEPFARQCGAVRAPRAGRAGTPDLDRQRSGARTVPPSLPSTPQRRARSRTPNARPMRSPMRSNSSSAWCPRTSWPPPLAATGALCPLPPAITARLDKLRADLARDAAKLAELRPQEQRYWRLVAERKGAVDARMQELRWLLEELRVSFLRAGTAHAAAGEREKAGQVFSMQINH